MANGFSLAIQIVIFDVLPSHHAESVCFPTCNCRCAFLNYLWMAAFLCKNKNDTRTNRKKIQLFSKNILTDQKVNELFSPRITGSDGNGMVYLFSVVYPMRTYST